MICPSIFRHPNLTAKDFHLQKFNSYNISCLISPFYPPPSLSANIFTSAKVKVTIIDG